MNTDDHDETILIEWHQDESSESEDFIKSIFGKKKKISKEETRKLKSSQEGKTRPRRSWLANPRFREYQGTPEYQEQKKDDNAGFNLEP